MKEFSSQDNGQTDDVRFDHCFQCIATLIFLPLKSDQSIHGIILLLFNLIVLIALFAYLNQRFLKLPSTIGIMIIAMMASIVVVFSIVVQGLIIGKLTELQRVTKRTK